MAPRIGYTVEEMEKSKRRRRSRWDVTPEDLERMKKEEGREVSSCKIQAAKTGMLLGYEHMGLPVGVDTDDYRTSMMLVDVMSPKSEKSPWKYNSTAPGPQETSR